MGQTLPLFTSRDNFLNNKSIKTLISVMGSKNSKEMSSTDDNQIYEKRQYFVKRFADKLNGSHFEFLLQKEICNSYEENRFYLKIAGISRLPRKPVPGQKIKTSAEKLKESQYYGSYVYIGDIDRKIRCLLYARKKGWPQQKLVGFPGTLNSVIPRYEGKTGHLIIGMKIKDSIRSSRKWSKYDDKNNKFESKGLYEMKSLSEMNYEFLNRRIRLNQIVTGIYVSKNTSLLMVDTTQPRLHCDLARNHVYTLFQEGGFVGTKCQTFFCFYDIEEDEEFDSNSLYANKKHLLKESRNLNNLIEKQSNELRSDRIIFLKSASKHTFWTLRVTRIDITEPIECQLCIPTGGQFENVLPWNEGIKVVRRRHERNPWHKYIELNTSITDSANENGLEQAYPLDENENYDTNQDFENLNDLPDLE